jgi:hypothetical protein
VEVHVPGVWTVTYAIIPELDTLLQKLKDRRDLWGLPGAIVGVGRDKMRGNELNYNSNLENHPKNSPTFVY